MRYKEGLNTITPALINPVKSYVAPVPNCGGYFNNPQAVVAGVRGVTFGCHPNADPSVFNKPELAPISPVDN